MNTSLFQYMEDNCFDIDEKKEKVYSFSKKELDDLINTEFNKGYDKGSQDINKQCLIVINEISHKFDSFAESNQINDEVILGLCGHLCRESLLKLFPSLEEKLCSEEIISSLGKMKDHIPENEKINFYVPSFIYEKITEYFLDNKRIDVNKDDSLSNMDCYIKWDGGGIDKKFNFLKKAVFSFLPFIKDKLITHQDSTLNNLESE